MKMSCKGIVTCIALLGFTTANANSLAEALSNGKMKGELKFEYVKNKDKLYGAPRKNADGIGAAIELGYLSDSFHNFQLGLTVQSNHDMGLQDDKEVDTRAAFRAANLTEAYLKYSFNDKNSLKVGRQYLYTPLAFTLNKSHASKEFFNGAFYTTKALTNTKLMVGAITEFFKRDTGFDGREPYHFDEPVYTLYVKNKSLKGLSLSAQVLFSNGDGEVDFKPYVIQDQSFLYSYVGTKYKLPIDFPVTALADYYNLNYKKSAFKDTSMYLLGASTKVSKFKFTFAHSKTDDDNHIIGTLGHVPVLSKNMATILDPGAAGMETNRLSIDYDLKNVGFKRVRLSYGAYEQEVSGAKVTDATETNLDFIYGFKGALKGLTTRIRFANADFDYLKGAKSDVNTQEFRFLAIYKF